MQEDPNTDTENDIANIDPENWQLAFWALRRRTRSHSIARLPAHRTETVDKRTEHARGVG
jgi:hypothetical protein